MRQDITEYKLQLQSQRNMMVARQDDSDMATKMMKKNRDLAEAMEELQVRLIYWQSRDIIYKTITVW